MKALTIDQLRKTCPPDIFDFNSTADLEPLDQVIGQDRAVGAITFGIEIESPGYHIFALGPVGTGKNTTIRKFLEQKSRDLPVPDDWCYVNNFEDEDQPIAMRLPAGRGRRLQRDVDQLVEDLEIEIPGAFESEDYEEEQAEIEEQFQARRQALFDDLEAEAQKRDFVLLQTPRGIVLAPVIDGEAISPEQFNQLEPATRERLQTRHDELQDMLRNTIREIQGLQQEAKEAIKELDRQVVGYAVEHLIDQIQEKYTELEPVVEFLDAVRADILQNVEAFKQSEEQKKARQQLPIQVPQGERGPAFDRFRVNLIVDNENRKGAPVVVESNPTFANLVGRIEHQARFGALVTSFRMIKSGALHRANGGYLILDARNVLTRPLAWDALQRALKEHEVEIESMSEAYGAISTRTLDPEPIPLDIKVVLLGDPRTYYLLHALDDDFKELFKVKADFGVRMDWNEQNAGLYARFIATLCREEGLKHLSPTGVARILEEASRMVADQERLATQFGNIADLIRQSSYWAGKAGSELVEGSDVERAIEEGELRSNRLEQRTQEMIEDGTILIDTEGYVPGQVNGISVLPLGDYAFGKPSRITARTHVGTSGVVNIDREARLGGRIHNKGVLILTGYLGGTFAREQPLALSASITFEQLYEEVEGDSAASAELYALLSSLAELPLRQDLAVTGSVNQKGEIQAIGGVNQKIEGFFEVCRRKGLTGSQGVVIPQANIRNLALRESVIEAAREGMFHIYPVSTIEEGLELLTGRETGVRDAAGNFPDGSAYQAVEQRLHKLTERVRSFVRINGSASEDGRVREREG